MTKSKLKNFCYPIRCLYVRFLYVSSKLPTIMSPCCSLSSESRALNSPLLVESFPRRNTKWNVHPLYTLIEPHVFLIAYRSIKWFRVEWTMMTTDDRLPTAELVHKETLFMIYLKSCKSTNVSLLVLYGPLDWNM